MIEVTRELGGNVKVFITIRGVTTVHIWKMSEAEAISEAEEIVKRKAA